MKKHAMMLGMMLSGLFSFSAQAVDDAQMQHCMSIADSLKRLDCFEKLARQSQGQAHDNAAQKPAETIEKEVIRAPVHPLQQTQPRTRNHISQVVPGKSEIERWLISVSVDPVNGGAQVVLRNKAVKGRNQVAIPVELLLECKAGRPSAQLLWREPMVKGEVPVLLFDGKNVGMASEGWQMDDRAENWIYRGDMQRLLDALSAHQKASARVQVMEENINFGDDVIDAWFNIAGAEYALKPLIKACF